MRLRKTACLLFVILLSTILLCCDLYNFRQLTETETDDLYYEIKRDIEKGDLWNFELHYDYQDAEINDNLSFLKEAVDSVLIHKELVSLVNGSYREGKNSCVERTKVYLLHITCEIPVSYNKTEYIIDSLNIGKYSNTERFSISIHYHKTDMDPNSSRIVIDLTR